VILAGLFAGIVAYYWLWPKVAAARIIRKVEAYNRLINDERKTE
jgi:hypothetical protein